MPPLYSGSADEWSYLSTEAKGSAMSVEFIIDNFENQMKRVSQLESHQFTVNDTLWHINVRTDSLLEDYKGHVGVHVYNENKEDLTVDVKFEIGDTVEGFVHKIEASGYWGYSKMLTHRECKSSLKDGKLIVKVVMKVLGEGTLIHGKGKSFNPIPDTSSMNLKIYEGQVYTDFRVVCNGKSFACHKAFFTVRSSVFKAMMENNMKEAEEGNVELKNCTETVAESFVKFFYTGQVDEEIMRENASSFLNLGEKYDLAGLKAISEQAMIATLDKDNMLSYFLGGDLYRGGNIRAAAKTFLRQNRASLVEQEGWKDVLTGREDLMLELLESFSKT